MRARLLRILALAMIVSCNSDETVVGTAVGLRFDTAVPNVAANAQLPTITVSIVDPIGNVVTGASHQITLLGIQNGSTTVSVSGTLQKAAVNGVATFTGLSIAQAGSGYSLVASGPGLASASSNVFTVTP